MTGRWPRSKVEEGVDLPDHRRPEDLLKVAAAAGEEDVERSIALNSVFFDFRRMAAPPPHGHLELAKRSQSDCDCARSSALDSWQQTGFRGVRASMRL